MINCVTNVDAVKYPLTVRNTNVNLYQKKKNNNFYGAFKSIEDYKLVQKKKRDSVNLWTIITILH